MILEAIGLEFEVCSEIEMCLAYSKVTDLWKFEQRQAHQNYPYHLPDLYKLIILALFLFLRSPP